jgi:hypothetical protein
MTIQEANEFWERPKFCPAPSFPIILFEISGAKECRGFLNLLNLTGDVDFVRYPLVADEFIIDSNGGLFILAFDKIVFPLKLIEKLTKQKLLDLVSPCIIFSKDFELLQDVITDNSIETIINKIAIKFTW